MTFLYRKPRMSLDVKVRVLLSTLVLSPILWAGSPRLAPVDASVAPRVIAGGAFEASGVAHVPDTDGVLFVDDGRPREIFLMELAVNGSQRGPAVQVPLAADITDLEGMTSDGTHFYVVGSQSKNRGFDGDGLVRFRFDAQLRRSHSVDRIQGFKAWLASHVRELRGTERQLGDHVLNIEALAWDPRNGQLLLGLRAPVIDGHALVIPIKLHDPAGAFSQENLRVAGDTIRLPLNGAGIRSLEYDHRASAFRIITGAGLNNENRDFRIIEWNGNREPSSLREIATFPPSLKPEGITHATIGGQPVTVVVFDTGRFTLLN